MTKKIVFSNGNVEEMSVNDLCMAFEDMINKFAHNCNNSLGKHKNNVDEFEDFYQLGMMEILSSFDLYDEKHCFSTLLQIRLNNLYKYLLRKLNTAKRNVECGLVYLNSEFEDGGSMEDVIGYTDVELSSIDSKIDIVDIVKNLDEQEVVIFKFLLEEEKTKIELAKELGISRPTLDTRIDRVRSKIKGLVA